MASVSFTTGCVTGCLVAPPVAPSPCPPCEPPTQPICPACPECPTTDAPNTAGNVGGEWPSYIPDSVSSTQPQGGTSTVVGPFSRHEPEEKDNAWMISSIVLVIVNLIQPFFWWYIWRRIKLCQEVHPKREVKADFNGCVVNWDGCDVKMANGQKKNDSDDRAAQKGNGPSGRISNPEGGPSAKECTASNPTGASKDRAAPLQNSSDETPGNNSAPSHSSQKATPPPRQGCSLKGDWPSTQPLLDSSMREGNTLASGVPTDIHQPNELASSVPDRAGERSLQSKQLRIPELHEAPSAQDWRPSPSDFTSETVHDSRGTPPNETTPLQSNGDAELPSKAPYNHPAPSMSGQQAAPLPRWGYNVKGDSPSAQPLLASMAQQGNTLPTDVYQQKMQDLKWHLMLLT
ncbi:uncharacterized protein LOC110989863 [Acanthaster planci]|uniref:Uncharacterized protein LOC110989863 n=1 Tax=Acanthaster planci TaxID=133434 RepID=A0A8B7ZZS3_ACAPL|nr:uncharacterized protein LOC110989863 [Acanthaster planci]